MNSLNKSDLKKLIAAGQIEELIGILDDNQDEIFDKINHDTFLVLSARFHKYKTHCIRGDEDPNNLKIEHVKILNGLINLVEKTRDVKINITPYSDEDSQNSSSLFYNIYNERLWDALSKCAREAVVVGGITAMGFYEGSWDETENIGINIDNPSTNADVEATISLLRSVDSILPKLCEKLKCDLQYFGEETGSKTQDLVLRKLSPVVASKIKSEEVFFSEKRNTIRVIFDAIDGTGNFKKGFPIFCSAIAILINNQPRISAIYDPVHHIVYSGLLPGPENHPGENSEGNIWHVSIGHKAKMAQIDKSKILKNENIGIHFTRSKMNHDQLTEMINHVENLVRASSGVYAINSGLFSLTQVARGKLGGFINNITNLWDVAAGEVLIKAVGGKVTDLEGNEINYSDPSSISVVAAPTQSLFEEIMKIVKK